MEMVSNIWTHTEVDKTSMERWQRKFRRLRQYLQDWDKNISDQYKKEKKEILNTLYMLDKKAEHNPLQADEINIRQCINNILTQLLREEEIK
jgi:hypothetical protein